MPHRVHFPKIDSPPQPLEGGFLVAPHFLGRLPVEGQPEAAILMGPICCGKSTLRREPIFSNHVSLDAADIWLKLSGSPEPQFPGPWEPLVHIVGEEVFRQAVTGKYNLVLEIIGADYAVLEATVERFLSLGYKPLVTYVRAPEEECQKRHAARNDDNLSAYFTEGFHVAWILGIKPDPLNDQEPGLD